MYFPLFLDLSDKEILVIGAGHIAARRIRSLYGFAGYITVIAPDISENITELIPEAFRDSDYFSGTVSENNSGGLPVYENSRDEGKTQVTVLKRCFFDNDLDGKDVVLAATDDAELNRHICGLCRSRGIPVNVCSDSSLCDFQFPSIVESGAVVIGINASGQDHCLVKETRKQVEALIREEQEPFHSRYQ